MMEYRAKATEAQIAELTKNQSRCKKSDNPKECVRILNKKINELKDNIRRYKQDAKYYRSSGHLFK